MSEASGEARMARTAGYRLAGRLAWRMAEQPGCQLGYRMAERRLG